MAKDLGAALAFFADDAVVIDPHYPVARMKGRAEIERGFKWGLASLEKPGFSIRNRAAEGAIAYYEIDTRHKLRRGFSLVVQTKAR